MFKYLPIVLGFVMVMSSCGEDEGGDDITPVTPQPTVAVSINGQVVANDGTYEAVVNESIVLAVTAQKADRDLDEVKLVQNGINAVSTGVGVTLKTTTEVYPLENNIAVSIKNDDDETFLGRDTLNAITNNVGVTSYTFTFTDKDGNVATSEISISVSAPDVQFTSTNTGRVYHIESSFRGSWSFTTDTTVSKTTSEAEADFRNTTAAGTAMNGSFKVGDLRTTSNFVVAPSTFDYDNATVTSAEAAYDAITAKSTSGTAADGNVYIYSVNGEIVLVKITEVNTTDNSGSTTNTGYIDFEYKK